MSLNIKDEEAHALARELAELTGETLTSAVTTAIRERLEQIRRDRDKDARLERLLAIARDAGRRWKEPYKSMNLDELLYDEMGLPKSDR